MKNLSVFAAFLGGAVAGAALGILFAPEKGDDTRAKIAEAVKKSGAKLNKEEFEKLVALIQMKLSKGNTIAEDILNMED
ncbi:MAG: YtxH domain-containing protein [Bacteroidales bacterium]|nr:YtxH domain-containing protein [Bacteroidales bacterium]